MANDTSTSIGELKDKVRSFCELRDWDQFHTGKDLAIGLVTEAAELLEIFRFQHDMGPEQLRAQGQWEDLEDEMADTLFFLLRLAQMWKIDLAQAFEKKLKKNDLRYPAEEFRGRNHKAPHKKS